MKRVFCSIAAIATLLLLLTSCTLGSTPTMPSPSLVLKYETVYQDGDFEVKEAYLGPLKTWKWANFVFPAARIQDTAPDPILHERSQCLDQVIATGWCTQSLEVVAPGGNLIHFDLGTNSQGMGGHYVLSREGLVIWEGDLYAVTTDAVLSWRKIGDQVAIEYLDIRSEGPMTHSILLTQDTGVADVLRETGYDEAFAPNEIRGRLAYFAHNPSADRMVLVFNGQEVGPGYIDVFNQYCCWDGPDVQVHGNGEIIDFFAYREEGWYHVQAGYFGSD